MTGSGAGCSTGKWDSAVPDMLAMARGPVKSDGMILFDGVYRWRKVKQMLDKRAEYFNDYTSYGVKLDKYASLGKLETKQFLVMRLCIPDMMLLDNLTEGWSAGFTMRMPNMILAFHVWLTILPCSTAKRLHQISGVVWQFIYNEFGL